MIHLGACLICFLALLAAWVYVLVVMAKVQRLESPDNDTPEARLQIADLLALFVFVLPPLVLFSNLNQADEESLPELLAVGVVIFLGVVVAWWLSVEALCTQGIFSGVRRFLFLAFVVPVGVVGGLASLLWLMLAPWLLAAEGSRWDVWCGIALLLAALGGGVGWALNRIFASPTEDIEQQQDPPAGSP